MQPMDGAAEERLRGRARAGDVQAFNRLVEPHQGTLYAIALRMLADDAAAADVTQESMLAAWQHLGSFHGGNFRAWLTRILVNRCYDVLRTRRRRPERSYDAILEEHPETEELAGAAPDPAQLLVSEELGRHLGAGLAALPVDQRAVVILCDVHGYGYAEAAEVEHTGIGTVKSRLSRGRARLRDWLAEQPELLPPGLRSVYTRDKKGRKE
jgi:RNA polymerase sigma-70 factor, ECF subfamily